MNDLIDRQAAIDFIDAGRFANPNEPRWSDNEVVNFLKSRPSAQPYTDEEIQAIQDLEQAQFDKIYQIGVEEGLQSAQRWIPCSERLPKYGKIVLITNDKGNVSYGRFRGVEFWKDDGDNFWTWKKNTIEHVLAWMPLPEPWKGERDG